MEKHQDCHHLLSELSEYVDGELRGDLCLELERHLANCNDCKIVVDTLKKTIYLIHANEDQEPVPANVRERLYKCLDLNEFLEA